MVRQERESVPVKFQVGGKFSPTIFMYTYYHTSKRSFKFFEKYGVIKRMNKINYQKILDQEIEKNKKDGRIPTLLLHSCCAPCSSYVLEYLTNFFHITVLYYNPNIFPESEYIYRTAELKRLITFLPVKYPVEMISTDYVPDDFYQAVKGLEQEPEGGERCFRCYRLRLKEAAEYAQKGNFDYFTTTLSISPMKNAEKLNQIGKELEQEYGVSYLSSDFKKKNGYLRSIELSKKYDLYRQDYCGCVYSKRERE